MTHENKYFMVILFLFGIGSIVFQSLVVPLLEIHVWRPDVVLIITLLTARRFGALKGSSAGFLLGIIQDSLTGMPVGITALPKTLGGYFAGKLRSFRPDPTYTYLWFAGIIFLHEIITYAFYQFKTDLSFTQLVYTRAFPNTVYSFIMLVIIHFFTQKYFNE
ncbi:MAG TPA: rod shape-determining protein MreD [Caldithrix abyssi]|uniref:Rod shape-determining protein MreD n=1 Tax=Caldithrix abyssi TaxID=187145 RepID=A0A7V5UE91_CALAY|nr:rod shape-determining protein MreD [Caldithrix abyssi]